MTFLKLVVILFLLEREHGSFIQAANMFVDILGERHIQWAMFSDTPPRYDDNKILQSLSTIGVSYHQEKFTDLHELETHHSAEEEGHLLAVMSYKNSSAFFDSLDKIVRAEQNVAINGHTVDSHCASESFHWKPKYYVTWPEICESPEATEEILREKILKKYSRNLTVASDVYFVIPYNDSNGVRQITIWEAYSINNVRNIYHKLLPFDWYNLTNKANRRRNFEGATLISTAVDDPILKDEVRFRDDGHGNVEFVSGSAVNLLWYLRDGLNFKVSAVKGNWTTETLEGVVGGGAIEIEKGLADLSISQTTMTAGREKHIHFLHPTYLEGINAYFVQPEASRFRDIYYKSFRKEVWMVLVLVWGILLVSMHFFAWAKNYFSATALIESEGELDKQILKESFLWALGSVCQQGWHTQPSSFSIRLIFLIGYLTGVVCFIAFSASIVSILSIKTVPIKTMSDFIPKSYNVYMDETNTALEYTEQIRQIQNGNSSFIVKGSYAITQLLDLNSIFLTFSDHFYIEAKATLRYSERYICETFSSVPVNKAAVRSAMMVPRDSPFTEFLNYQIILMRERGLNFRFMMNYKRTTEVTCLDLNMGYTQSLGMIDVQTAFIILVIGHVLSGLILCAEIGEHFYKMKRVTLVQEILS